jgi:hypothetical protein
MGLILAKPSIADKLADSLKNSFSQNYCGMTHKALSQIITCYVAGCRSLNDFTRSYPKSMSVSSLCEAIAKFDPSHIIKRLRKRALKRILQSDNPSEDFIFTVDDTDNLKYGKYIHGIGRFNKHGKISYQGQRIIFLVMTDRKTGRVFPLAYQFCTNQNTSDHIPGCERVILMLKELKENGFPSHIPLVADSWFAGDKFVNQLTQEGFTYVLEAKRNWYCKSYDNGTNSKYYPLTVLSKQKKKERVSFTLYPSNSRLRRTRSYQQKTFVGRFRSFKKSARIVCVYNQNGQSTKEPFAYYFTNAKEKSAEWVITRMRERWSIEVMFRDLKQNLLFGKHSLRGATGAHLSVCIPLMLYDELSEQSETTEQPNCTLGYQLKKLRAEMERRTETQLIEGRHFKQKVSGISLKELIEIRRSLERINKKVVNSSSDSNSNKKTKCA